MVEQGLVLLPPATTTRFLQDQEKLLGPLRPALSSVVAVALPVGRSRPALSSVVHSQCERAVAVAASQPASNWVFGLGEAWLAKFCCLPA